LTQIHVSEVKERGLSALEWAGVERDVWEIERNVKRALAQIISTAKKKYGITASLGQDAQDFLEWLMATQGEAPVWLVNLRWFWYISPTKKRTESTREREDYIIQSNKERLEVVIPRILSTHASGVLLSTYHDRAQGIGITGLEASTLMINTLSREENPDLEPIARQTVLTLRESIWKDQGVFEEPRLDNTIKTLYNILKIPPV